MVIAVRAHDGNPWLMPRLRMLGCYYDPLPAVVIVDLGSPPSHRAEVGRICRAQGFRHLVVDDAGVYSAAVGRNRGAEAAQTDLIFLTDIDCFGDRDLFARLAKHANDMNLQRCFDQIIVLPAYHLTADFTAQVMTAAAVERPSRVSAAMASAVFGARGTTVEYVDPFSNFLLCRRDFFSLMGGYNEHFRGHGSEDYEFLLRCAAEVRQLPLPVRLEKDRFSPVRNEFFAGRKPYEGFRRLGEVMAYPAEAAGLRIAHLHHPRPAASDSWYANRDGMRTRFKAQVLPYLKQPEAALGYDWLQRDQCARVIMGPGRKPRDLALPMRLLGYALRPLVVSEDMDPRTLALQQGGGADDLIIVEPGLPRSWANDRDRLIASSPGTVWTVSSGATPGEFVYRAHREGRPVREGTGVFRPLAAPSVRGSDATGWLFVRLPFSTDVLERAALVRPFANDCYASGKLQLVLCSDDIESHRARSAHPRQLSLSPDRLRRRMLKMVRDPVRFMVDSTLPPLRLLGTWMLFVSRRL